MNDDLNHPITPSPGTLPEAERVTEETEFCHLAETAVTSLKINENNDVSADCHRSIYTHSGAVTSIKNDRPAKRKKSDTVSDYERTVTATQWKRDCLKLSATQLQALYPGTYQAFFAMKYVRSKPIAEGGEGAIIHDSVSTLAKFIRALGGPRLGEEITVDRLDRLDPEYSADKIVWENKTGQARNRSTNSLVLDPMTGDWATVAEVAEQVGLQANTITQALRRALKKEPDETKHEAIRGNIVRVLLDKRPGHATSAAPVSTEEVSPPPMPVRTAPIDFRMRWPVDMPKDQRDRWNQSFKEGRKVINEDEGELEWRHEFYIRTIREWLVAAGFGGNMIGRSPSREGTELDKMRNSWRDPENPTVQQLTEYGELEDIYDRMFARLREALAVLPEFEAEARQRRRERDRTYPRYGRYKPSRDYEDEAMKDDEAFGHIEDDEVETGAAPALDNWREETARDYAARRRGIEL